MTGGEIYFFYHQKAVAFTKTVLYFSAEKRTSERTMKTLALSISVFFVFICLPSLSQVRIGDASLSVFTGTINYQGDLKPNSFTFNHSNLAVSVVFRKGITRWLSWRSGVSIGKIEGADRYNRDYLKPRNLSFYTSIKEIYTGFSVNLLDVSTKRFTPYAYGGLVLYHFNPWTYDKNGEKVFLKPLSTEGEGLPEYPNKKPYKLTQFALAFGGGIKFAVTECLNVGIEFSQRKTFTDYLDDVSGYFVDGNVLMQERGAKAVELSYRGDELPDGNPNYPAAGEQRGTHSEMDWYYFLGVTLEIRISKIENLFSSWRKEYTSSYQMRCPINLRYQ